MACAALCCGTQDPARGAAATTPSDAGRLDAARITSGEFAPQRFGPARWLDGQRYATLEPAPGADVLELVAYDAASGARTVLVSAAMLWVEAQGRALPIEDYQFSPDGTRLCVFTDSERVWRENTRGEYYLLPLDGKAAPRRLGGALPKATLQFAKFSPDGTRVGYVAQNDLFVEDLATGRQTRLTKDGSDTVVNGTFDWVYEEEFDCRDGFRWSPDGTRIAYWQLDTAGVGTFFMIDNLSDRYARIVPVQYPKAGTTNSACKFGVFPATGGDTVWMATSGDPRETYLPRMEWHPGGKELVLQWLPREQNRIEVLAADAATGRTRVVWTEREAAYIDVRGDFLWLDDGAAFFWTGDGDGFRHARRIGWDGEPAVLLTPGDYDVMAVERVAVEQGVVYVSASPENATQKYLCRVPLAGGPLERVTPVNLPRRYAGFVAPKDGEPMAASGWHDYQISPDGSFAIHTWSAFDQAPVVDLVRLPSHEVVRVLVDNTRLRSAYAAVEKGEASFFQVETPDGVALDGWVMLPKDFDGAKSWPVVFHVYGEPWSQTVKDTWFLGHHLFHRWLNQQGYVVMSLDARGTPAPKGRDWRKALYQNIGVVSSHDWNGAVRALCERHTWIDRSRLAVWGWSGGGAMTLNLLFRHPGLFAAGMSVAPVTDIALYDTIYQERYCGDPRQVPEVYARCSPITFAGQLQDHLLLVHGTGDDNVHWQHAERLFDALVAHGKLFEYLAYPNRTHAIREGKGTRQHLYASLLDFLRRRVPAGPK
jgi:dipeptidyl-peptidase 4